MHFVDAMALRRKRFLVHGFGYLEPAVQNEPWASFVVMVSE